jgi:hypothetical protein
VIENLRSSMFKSYCMGLRTSRKKQLEYDKTCAQKKIWDTKYIDWGTKHEVNGVAKWIKLNGKMPKYILDEQESFVIPGWHDGIGLSTTPDGLSGTCLIEIKCSAMGKNTYSEFPEEHLWQVYGQQMIMSHQGHDIEKTHLVNWTPKHTKIWEIQRNQDYEDYMSLLLKDYIEGLVHDKKLTPKPEAFQGKHKIELIYNNGDNNGKS